MAYEPMRLPFQPQWLGFGIDYCKERLQQTANALGREVVYNFNGKDITFIPVLPSMHDYLLWTNPR
jgi:hypothetical protein